MSNIIINNQLVKITLLIFLSCYQLHALGDIIVSGYGQIEQKPNIVTFNVSIETKSLNAKETAAENAKQTDKAINVLKSVISDSKAISTQGYTLFPEYKYDRKQESSIFVGFKAVNTIFVKTKQIAMIGEIMDKVIASGVSGVNNLVFSYDAPEELYQRALIQAIQNGLDRARVIARASSLEIDRIFDLKVKEGLAPEPLAPQAARMFAEQDLTTTPINAPDVKTSAVVELTILTK